MPERARKRGKGSERKKITWQKRLKTKKRLVRSLKGRKKKRAEQRGKTIKKRKRTQKIKKIKAFASREKKVGREYIERG